MFKEEGLLSLSQGRSGWREGTEEFLTLVEEHGKACGATGGGEEAEEGIVPYGFEAEVVEVGALKQDVTGGVPLPAVGAG